MTRLTAHKSNAHRRTSEEATDWWNTRGGWEKKKRQISAELDEDLELGVVYLSHLGHGELHYFLFPLPRKECSSQEASSFN